MIELHNYEEYFLLYADNELTEQERQDVEVFVLRYPHLKSELDMLMETVINPDEEVVLNDKENLLKFGGEKPAFEKKWEELFVLYHDGELSGEQRKEVEEHISKDAAARAAFDVFASLKFVAGEDVKYPHKAHLYRHEAPVVKMVVWRSVAAAVVLSLVLWGSYNWISKNYEERMVAGVTEYQGTPDEVPLIAGNETTSEKKPHVKPEQIAEPKVEAEPVHEIPSENRVQYARHTPEATGIADAFVKAEAPSKKDVTPVTSVTSVEPVEPVEAEKIETRVITAQALTAPEINLKAEEILNSENPVQYISYASNTNAQQNEDYIFYNVTFEEFRRTKVGAFLKQVSRVIDRTDPVKLLLSAEGKDVTYRN